MLSLTQLPQWRVLQNHYHHFFRHITDGGEASVCLPEIVRPGIEVGGVYLDYSKHHITDDTLSYLVQLAQACDLEKNIASLFSGDWVNVTEQQPVLHTALRQITDEPLYINGQDVIADNRLVWEQMKRMIHLFEAGEVKGYTGRSIQSIVCLGVGGSGLGPQMLYHVLKPYVRPGVCCYFISNQDEADSRDILVDLDPEITLFIVVSKTFTTQETLANADRAKRWLLSHAKDECLIQPQFLAVTAEPKHAKAYGIDQNNIFVMPHWVGGRFSIWSAVGLGVAMCIGWEAFHDFLSGACMMDTHFRNAPLHNNMPVLLGLLSIWYINFFHAPVHAVIPYSQRLCFFPEYLKQLHMESQGKSVRGSGEKVDYHTGAVILGGVGTNSQHSFHQLLFQGTVKILPVDFIIPLADDQGRLSASLIANGLAQSDLLMRGCDRHKVLAELKAKHCDDQVIDRLVAHQVINGSIPSNVIMLDQLTPYHCGALLALYEHKVYVQCVIWNINAFDQWGVERGKHLSQVIAAYFEGRHEQASLHPSTYQLIEYVMKRKKSNDCGACP